MRAAVLTPEGFRCLSGTGAGFLLVLWVMLLLCGARQPWVTFVADGARLEELISYLTSREASLVNYRERWVKRQYTGSGGVEKGNDLIVARRMKRKGMHWSLETADSLAALQTLWLNHGWDLNWGRREVLRLAAP